MATKIRVELSNVYVRAAAGIMTAPHVAETIRAIATVSAVRAPVRTGNLRSSRYTKLIVKPSSIGGEVGYRAKYAQPVHQGSKGHAVRAVRARALRFNWPKVGAVTYVPLRGFPFTGHTRVGTFIIGKGYVWIPRRGPRPFLTSAMVDVGQARGYRVNLVSTAR